MLLLSYSYNLYTLRQILHVAYVLVFQSCYSKEPQTQNRNIFFSYCFGGQSLKSRCQRGHTPSEGSREQGKTPPLPLCLLWVPVILGSLPWSCIMPICLHNYLAFFPACLHVISCCPGVSVVKNSPANTGDVGLIPGSGNSLEKEWQPIPVFLPGKSHGEGSLAGCSPWGCKELDMT